MDAHYCVSDTNPRVSVSIPYSNDDRLSPYHIQFAVFTINVRIILHYKPLRQIFHC